jgi:7,8-dihydropterin-6-yl-methyl-4-(beta-D-ribofuranosyl)aminobenzene 5'-phosphate synthase
MRKEVVVYKILVWAISLSTIGVIVAPATRDTSAAGPEIQVTVLYDNTSSVDGLKPDWGFSCLVTGTEKTILFDAGTKADTFSHNVDALNVDLKEIDLVVISHEHGDHTGGLSRLYKVNPDVSVFYPVSFSSAFVQSVSNAHAKPVPVNEPVEICKDVFVTGEMGTEIKEQSLVLKTPEGLVVITGCSHPGIVEILERTKQLHPEDIYMVLGGFHLMRHSDEAVGNIIKRFKELGVQKCGATHCTGDPQIELIKSAFGPDFVSMGVGKVVMFGKSTQVRSR